MQLVLPERLADGIFSRLMRVLVVMALISASLSEDIPQ